MTFDRLSIKKYLFERYKQKIKEPILLSNIEGLVDEYIDNQTYIQENGCDVKDLPTKHDMKWWFQDKAEDSYDIISGDSADLYEVNIDQICLEDKIAHFVYTDLYNYEWKQGDLINPIVSQLIKNNLSAEKSRDKNLKIKVRTRLYNIALVGTIRFYHMERKPYLTLNQMEIIEKNFIKYLKIIDKVSNGEYKDQKVSGSIYIFSGLKENNKND